MKTVIGEYIEVEGITNTCAKCGKSLDGVAYARNHDAAVAGDVYHEKCVPGWGLAAQSEESLAAEPDAKSSATSGVTIDLSDGVSDAEASASGKALQARSKSTRRRRSSKKTVGEAAGSK